VAKTLKNFYLFILLLLGYVNNIIPKRNYILFFSNESGFNDNNKAMLDGVLERGLYEKYKIIYCSRDSLKDFRYKHVIYRHAYFAPFYFLISKYCFYDGGTIKISPSIAQKVISLWHGIPLKKIGAMISEKTSFLDRYNQFTKILVPHPSLIKIYKEAFECTDDQILISGFPRNDYLLRVKKSLLSDFGIGLNFTKHILWMPTYRKSINGRYLDGAVTGWDLPIFKNMDELIIFDELLESMDVNLTIKLHPYSSFNLEETNVDLSNISFIRNIDLNTRGVINYELVACYDSLITDYSSVLFDYLLTNNPIGFTVDDIRSYKKNRGFTFSEPEDCLVGCRINSKETLIDYIRSIVDENDIYFDDRSALKERVYLNQDGSSIDALIGYLEL